MRHLMVSLVSATAVFVVYFSVDALVELWPTPLTREQIRASGSCDFPFEDSVPLTQGDVCTISFLKERCGTLDACFVDCLTSGRGIGVGGGCAHLCNYGWEIDWQPPEGVDGCYAADTNSKLPI